MDTDKPTKVMVTGATGYVAGWLIKELLDAGHTVHAAVRDPDNSAKVAPLTALATASPGELKLFAADLLAEGSYDDAASGCEIIFHTASPFVIRVKDPQRDLIDPALNGTRNVLETANRTDSVKRVVLTSSCAAIYSDNVDCENAPGGVLTEEVWNTTSTADYNPYQYSKTVAERAAWDMAKAQQRWDLVVINPSLVLGPAINPRATSESFAIVKQMGDGRMRPGVPHIGMGTIDVRDLAVAHYRAGFLAEAHGRNIVSSNNTSLLELAAQLLEKYGRKYPIPRRQIPKFLVWLVGPSQGYPRRFVRDNMGHDFRADNSKAVKELQLSFRDLKTTMEDMFQQLIDDGQLKSR